MCSISCYCHFKRQICYPLQVGFQLDYINHSCHLLPGLDPGCGGRYVALVVWWWPLPHNALGQVGDCWPMPITVVSVPCCLEFTGWVCSHLLPLVIIWDQLAFGELHCVCHWCCSGVHPKRLHQSSYSGVVGQFSIYPAEVNLAGFLYSPTMA